MNHQSTPVRIELTLRTPMIVPTTGKHLDALLSWAAVQQADFFGADDPIAEQHKTGLARYQVGQAWCFQASLLDYEWIGEPDQIHYVKRSKLEDYAGAWDAGLFRKKPYFDGARGATKAGSYLQPMRWVQKIRAYAIAEDIDRVEELLPWITHVGKLSHKDFGAVSSCTVHEDQAAHNFWTRRTLPSDSPLATSHVKAIGALVSPYWKRENFSQVAMFCA